MEMGRSNFGSREAREALIFEAYWENQSQMIEVQESGSQVTLRVNGELYVGDLIAVGPGRYSILFGGRVFDVFVDSVRNGEFQVALQGRRFSLELADPRKLKSLRHRHADAGGDVAIVSPMPGKIVRLLVKEGEKVELGQGLVVVEAMKMQNELRAPRSGVVKSVNVHEGRTVSGGEELMVIS